MRQRLLFLTQLSLAVWWIAAGEGKGQLFDAPGPIVDANPALREVRQVLVPAGFGTARTADFLAVCKEAGPLKSIKLKVGHKMVLGTRTKLFIYPEGTQRPLNPFWEELSSGTPTRVSNLYSFYKSEPFGFVKRGKPYVTELEVAIFETDIPPQHMWGPEGKNYKVLWQTNLRRTPREEREFPPEVQSSKVLSERIKGQPTPMPEMPDDFLATKSEAWKAVLATEITAGFQYASVRNVLEYFAQKSNAAITLATDDGDADKLRRIFRGFDQKPLRAALYEVTQDAELDAAWKLNDEGVPVGIIVTERKH